jgi:hypothetical protein
LSWIWNNSQNLTFTKQAAVLWGYPLIKTAVYLEKADVPGTKIIKPGYPFPGNPAISQRPVAFRPRLTTGLAFSFLGKNANQLKNICQVFSEIN